MSKSVIIIGGGASGLMAALSASAAGARVTILEHNEKPGRKILATGNGRCNFTNRDQSLSHYHSSDPEKAEKILQQFPAAQTLHLFSSLGIWPKERNGWYYPNSDQAQAVLDVLLLELQNRKVKIKTREQVTEIRKQTDETFEVLTEGWHYTGDAVVLASGSCASQVTGSSADGIRLIAPYHIKTKPFLPALCPLQVTGLKNAGWMGVRIRAAVTMRDEQTGQILASDTGEIQLTDRGISGIPVFQTAHAAIHARSEGYPVTAELDFLPGMTEEELRMELEKRREACPYKTLSQLLIGLLPDKLIKTILDNKKDPEVCISRIKHHTLRIEGQRDVTSGQVCQGGILLSECTDQLELRKVPGLYAVGELLDVHGDCGGYNLQWAWTTGYIAGRAAALSQPKKAPTSIVGES